MLKQEIEMDVNKELWFPPKPSFFKPIKHWMIFVNP